MGEAGADVVGVDWRTPLEHAIPLVGDRVVQGNLDPTLVFAPDRGDDRARRPRSSRPAARAKGHIFNLGHGVIPSHRPRPARAADRVRAVLPALGPALAGRGRRTAYRWAVVWLVRDDLVGESALHTDQVVPN